jgi:hypothetical protein
LIDVETVCIGQATGTLHSDDLSLADTALEEGDARLPQLIDLGSRYFIGRGGRIDTAEE